MKAFLILEDGTVFEGTNIGSTREVVSEIVFNTSMTGYLEMMTDPSNAGQAIVMTYPLIGNCGICYEDMESERPWIDALIVRELSRLPSNFRSEDTIQNFLLKYDIPGIAGIDTRALTKILRERGTMNGCITTNENYQLEEILPKLSSYSIENAVEKATCREKYVLSAAGVKVAVLDLGVRKSVVAGLNAKGCEVTVYPAGTAAEEILAGSPDGVFLTDGPGNPAEYESVVEELKKLYKSDVPMMAVGLGHFLLALANGLNVQKMKFGHHGGNYPVKNLKTGGVYISSQNHDYTVETEGMDPSVAVPAFINVNDGTSEGLEYTGKKIISVQYNPELKAALYDTENQFDCFMKMMEV